MITTRSFGIRGLVNAGSSCCGRNCLTRERLGTPLGSIPDLARDRNGLASGAELNSAVGRKVGVVGADKDSWVLVWENEDPSPVRDAVVTGARCICKRKEKLLEDNPHYII